MHRNTQVNQVPAQPAQAVAAAQSTQPAAVYPDWFEQDLPTLNNDASPLS